VENPLFLDKKKMDKQEALRTIISSREKARVGRYLLWMAIILVGGIGWLFWKWYAFLIAVVVGLIFGFVYSTLEGERVQRITGLAFYEIENLYKEHVRDHRKTR